MVVGDRFVLFLAGAKYLIRCSFSAAANVRYEIPRMIWYQLALTALLVLLLAIALANYATFARIRRNSIPLHPLPASILVPARNEERNIERCVGSLLKQEYPEFEVVVLNDNSTDATGEILQRLAAANPRLTILEGGPLPSGWVGKNWACHQLARAATGTLLLFTDADTDHSPESLRAAVALMQQQRLDLLSGVPRQTMLTFWEKVIVPMTQFLYFVYLPNVFITRLRNPQFAAFNGQFMLFRREAYWKIGGHESVRGALIEDLVIGRRAKAHGLRTALATAVETVRCRMYTSLPEILEGFAKNLVPGFGYSLPAVVGFMAATLLLYVVPAVMVVVGLAVGDCSVAMVTLPALQLAIAATMRGIMAIRFGMGWEQLLLHPLSAAMAAVVAANSIRWHFGKRGASWKGRRYV